MKKNSATVQIKQIAEQVGMSLHYFHIESAYVSGDQTLGQLKRVFHFSVVSSPFQFLKDGQPGGVVSSAGITGQN